MSASLVSESWDLVSSGIDPEEDLPVAVVAREKHYHDGPKLTVWKLMQRPNGWYNVGQMISTGVFRTYPERKGVKLSDSRIDNILREFATMGESSLV